jgi:O-antigen ligase
MAQISSFLRATYGDRIQLMAILVVACFVSVLLLSSQSRASYPTYALALLMLVTFRQWSDVLRLTAVKLIVALLVWLSASAFWSEPFNLRDAISVWSRALLVFFFVVAVAECQLRGQVQRWMAKALVAVGGLAMFAALVNFWVSNPSDGRLNGLGQLDTHVIAALMYGVVVIFALRVILLDGSLFWRLLAFTTIILGVVCIALSDSRTAWVSVTLGLLAYLLSHWIKDSKQMILAVGSVALIGAAVFFALIANDEIRMIVLPRGDSFRYIIWSEILSRISTSPLFGLGIITSDDVLAGDMVFRHPHNLYLALLFQGGAIALLMYLSVIGLTVSILLKNYEHDDAKLALSLLLLASSAFLLDGHELVDKIGESWFLIWLAVAIGLGFRWRIITPT